MARKVGDEGKVYAVDIQREMLQLLRQRADRFDLQNIQPVLGTIDDPKLPRDVVDMVLMVDVYHEFSHPQSMLWEIRRSLKSTGVVALLEYREEDLSVPIKPLHKMSKRQIMKEYEANGFKLVREYNELPWQHLMFLLATTVRWKQSSRSRPSKFSNASNAPIPSSRTLEATVDPRIGI